MVLLEALLVLMEMAFLWVLFCPRFVDDFEIVHAMSTRKMTPTYDSKTALQKASCHVQTINALVDCIIVGLLVLNMLAIVKVARVLVKERRSDSARYQNSK